MKEISQVRNQVEGLVKDLDLEYVAPLRRSCQESIEPLAGKIDYRQPYTALVLADLILARGSPDEAIAMLVEWLDILDSYRKKPKEAKNKEETAKISEWWQLRVMSRISLLLADVAGQNNVAYRDFFGAYKKEMEKYFQKGNIAVSRLRAKCDWPTREAITVARDVAAARSANRLRVPSCVMASLRKGLFICYLTPRINPCARKSTLLVTRGNSGS